MYSAAKTIMVQRISDIFRCTVKAQHSTSRSWNVLACFGFGSGSLKTQGCPLGDLWNAYQALMHGVS